MAPHDAPSQFSPLSSADPREVAGYQLRARLGAGGMGSVYLSYTRGGQPVALKVVRAELAEDPDFRRRFELEVRAARQVQGVYTVPVLDSNTEGAAPWLATAYVPGLSLADSVRAYGALPFETVLLLVAGVAEALQSIHAAGVVHRDLKPGNVLLSADGPKVIDFGIARAADTTSVTGTDVRVGTPAYMAPEQITGSSAGPATDVFALGIVAYHAATAGHPFGEGSAHAVMYRIVQEPADLSGAPEPLRPLLEACLAKQPAGRPSPDQVIEACRSLAPGRTLRREEGWLPTPVAREVTERVNAEPPPVAVPPAAAGPAAFPAAPPPPPPGPPPGGVGAAGAVTASQDAGPPSRRGRRSAALLAATAVVAAIAGGVVAVQLTGGDDGDPAGGPAVPGPEREGEDGSSTANDTEPSDASDAEADASDPDADDAPPSPTGPPADLDPDADYWLAQEDVELAFRAPRYHDQTDVLNGSCYGAYVTAIELDELTVATGMGWGSGDYLNMAPHVEYTYCDDERFLEDGVSFDSDLFVGTIDDPEPTPEECYDAAHTPTLPNPIPPDDILRDATLQADMGLCFETPEKTVVLLWIDEVQADPNNQDLRSYRFTGTQWKPNE